MPQRSPSQLQRTASTRGAGSHRPGGHVKIEPLSKPRMERMRGEVPPRLRTNGSIPAYAGITETLFHRFFRAYLHIESEIHHIRFLDHILFPFEPEQPLFLYLRFRPAGHQVIVGIDLGSDEASFHVGVDFPSRLRCR